MSAKSVSFKLLRFHKYYDDPIYKIYCAVENDRSKVLEHFSNLSDSEKRKIRNLIGKMASIENYRSNNIRWVVKKYKYGELKSNPHRFFFFRKYGDSLIFFDYREKKKGSLGDKVYRMIEQERIRYEEEFRRFIQRNG